MNCRHQIRKGYDLIIERGTQKKGERAIARIEEKDRKGRESVQ